MSESGSVSCRRPSTTCWAVDAVGDAGFRAVAEKYRRARCDTVEARKLEHDYPHAHEGKVEVHG